MRPYPTSSSQYYICYEWLKIHLLNGGSGDRKLWSWRTPRSCHFTLVHLQLSTSLQGLYVNKGSPLGFRCGIPMFFMIIIVVCVMIEYCTHSVSKKYLKTCDFPLPTIGLSQLSHLFLIYIKKSLILKISNLDISSTCSYTNNWVSPNSKLHLTCN